MDVRPITFRQAILWIVPGSVVGASLALTNCWLIGLFGNIVANTFFSGFGGAFGALVGLKIAYVRRRERP